MASKTEPPKSPWAYNRDLKKAREDLEFFQGFAERALAHTCLSFDTESDHYEQSTREMLRVVDEGVRLLLECGDVTRVWPTRGASLHGASLMDCILHPHDFFYRVEEVFDRLPFPIVLARLENRVAALQKGQSENWWAWFWSMWPWVIKGVSSWFAGLNRFLQVLLSVFGMVVVAMLTGFWDVVLALIPYIFDKPPAP